MSTSVAVSAELSPVPLASAQSSASPPTVGVDSFHKVLDEQTAKTFVASEHGDEASDRSTKRTRTKGESSVANVDTPVTSASTTSSMSPVPTQVSVPERFADLESEDASADGSPQSSRDQSDAVLEGSQDATGVSRDELAITTSADPQEIVTTPTRAIAPATITASASDPTLGIATGVTSLATRVMASESFSQESARGDVQATPILPTSVLLASVPASKTTLASALGEAPGHGSPATLRVPLNTRSSAPSTMSSRDAVTRESISATEPSSESTPRRDYFSATTLPMPTTSSLSALALRPALIAQATTTSAATSSLDVDDLAKTISQATTGADGSYTVNVAMHPSELGHVQAVVTVNGEDLHVAISPQTTLGHAALSNAVEGLKGELARGGLNVNISLRDPRSHSGGPREDATPPQSSGAVTAEDTEVDAPLESLSLSQIHLVL